MQSLKPGLYSQPVGSALSHFLQNASLKGVQLEKVLSCVHCEAFSAEQRLHVESFGSVGWVWKKPMLQIHPTALLWSRA